MILLLAACGGRDAPDSGTRSNAAKSSGTSAGAPVVLFIGTSLTAGYGLSPEDAWTSDIQTRIDERGWQLRVVNAGVSGETSAGALGRIDWVLRENSPRFVMIETGANDGLRGLSVAALSSNLDSILTTIEALSPRPAIVVAGMEALPNMGAEYVNQFRRVFPEAAARYHARYLPFLLDGVAGVARFNQADGIHPNREGSDRVAANVWNVIEPILDSIVHATVPAEEAGASPSL